MRCTRKCQHAYFHRLQPWYVQRLHRSEELHLHGRKRYRRGLHRQEHQCPLVLSGPQLQQHQRDLRQRRHRHRRPHVRWMQLYSQCNHYIRNYRCRRARRDRAQRRPFRRRLRFQRMYQDRRSPVRTRDRIHRSARLRQLCRNHRAHPGRQHHRRSRSVQRLYRNFCPHHPAVRRLRRQQHRPRLQGMYRIVLCDIHRFRQRRGLLRHPRLRKLLQVHSLVRVPEPLADHRVHQLHRHLDRGQYVPRRVQAGRRRQYPRQRREHRRLRLLRNLRRDLQSRPRPQLHRISGTVRPEPRRLHPRRQQHRLHPVQRRPLHRGQEDPNRRPCQDGRQRHRPARHPGDRLALCGVRIRHDWRPDHPRLRAEHRQLRLRRVYRTHRPRGREHRARTPRNRMLPQRHWNHLRHHPLHREDGRTDELPQQRVPVHLHRRSQLRTGGSVLQAQCRRHALELRHRRRQHGVQ